jgi:hypothetical protein
MFRQPLPESSTYVCTGAFVMFVKSDPNMNKFTFLSPPQEPSPQKIIPSQIKLNLNFFSSAITAEKSIGAN